MFDDLNNSTPPANAKPASPASRPNAPAAPAAPVAPSRAEDIFADVDQNEKPEVFKPTPEHKEPPRGTVLPAEVGHKSHKAMVFGMLIGGIIIIAAGGYLGLRLALNSGAGIINDQVTEEQPKNTGAEPVEPATPEAEKKVEPVVLPPVIEEPVDSDFDGLTNEEENSLGTNPDQADTDQDGLTDRAEVKVYNTDPLNPDTDGDSYKDGDEIKNGYNPKGAGKLLEINQ